MAICFRFFFKNNLLSIYKLLFDTQHAAKYNNHWRHLQGMSGEIQIFSCEHMMIDFERIAEISFLFNELDQTLFLDNGIIITRKMYGSSYRTHLIPNFDVIFNFFLLNFQWILRNHLIYIIPYRWLCWYLALLKNPLFHRKMWKLKNFMKIINFNKFY